MTTKDKCSVTYLFATTNLWENPTDSWYKRTLLFKLPVVMTWHNIAWHVTWLLTSNCVLCFIFKRILELSCHRFRYSNSIYCFVSHSPVNSKMLSNLTNIWIGKERNFHGFKNIITGEYDFFSREKFTIKIGYPDFPTWFCNKLHQRILNIRYTLGPEGNCYFSRQREGAHTHAHAHTQTSIFLCFYRVQRTLKRELH